LNSPSFHTLIVDDEPNIRLFLRVTLEKAGHTIVEAENGMQALEMIRETSFNIVILDLNLGGKIDGLRVLEGIRWRWPETIVIILTGHGTLESSIAAIREGADGYLLKPIDDHELLQTIDDILRRVRQRGSENHNIDCDDTLVQGHIRLDPALYRIYISERVVELTLNEYNLMRCLISNPNLVVSARELVRAVQHYDPETEIEAREIIKWYIHRLRKKIEPDISQPRYLLNVRGIGYRLES